MKSLAHLLQLQENTTTSIWKTHPTKRAPQCVRNEIQASDGKCFDINKKNEAFRVYFVVDSLQDKAQAYNGITSYRRNTW